MNTKDAFKDSDELTGEISSHFINAAEDRVEFPRLEWAKRIQIVSDNLVLAANALLGSPLYSKALAELRKWRSFVSANNMDVEIKAPERYKLALTTPQPKL